MDCGPLPIKSNRAEHFGQGWQVWPAGKDDWYIYRDSAGGITAEVPGAWARERLGGRSRTLLILPPLAGKGPSCLGTGHQEGCRLDMPALALPASPRQILDWRGLRPSHPSFMLSDD